MALEAQLPTAQTSHRIIRRSQCLVTSSRDYQRQNLLYDLSGHLALNQGRSVQIACALGVSDQTALYKEEGNLPQARAAG